ncbi:M56 family metallopeptidase [Flavobacterium sp.]|uniref:M56 family metallopeptidase n=1 Tax=Flavobacterium sp. TaxID=239 RepID=UPI003342E13A
MEAVFTYILKVNALLILFYLVYRLALSKETFYKQSRWFLLSGLFVSLILPFVTFTKIEYIEVKQVIEESLGVVKISKEVIQEPLLTNQEIVFLIYGIICFGFLIKTVFDFIKLFKIINVSNSEKRNKLVYVNTNLVHTPFSFFNYIIFNSDVIHPTELENIIKHEEVHSNQKHSLDTLAAQFFIILFWFNPIVWLYRKSMVQNLEFLADNLAIQHVSDKVYYQRTMLKVSTQASNISIVNTFNQSSIKKRIIMLNSNQSNRKNIWKFGIILPFVTAFMLLFQIETIAQEKFVEEDTNKYSFSSGFSSIVNKDKTDKDLEVLEKMFSNEDQTLTISNVQRNESNEIIAIKLVFDSGKTYNQVFERKSTTPIDDIKIFANTDKNKEKTCGFLEISTTSEKGNKDEVIEVDGFETNENPKYFSIDNMTKNGKEVVLIVNGKIKVPTEKMKIPYDEELGEMKEITPAEFEKKYNKNSYDDKYYYEVETVKIKLNEKNTTLEVQPIISESETQPEPQNGMQEFRKQIAMKFRLPEVENDVNVTIVAKFLVSKTGQILNITIPKEEPKNLGLGEELKRILKESPNWKPGTINGKPVDVNFALPVSIKITANK